MAAKKGHIAVVDALLGAGADANQGARGLIGKSWKTGRGGGRYVGLGCTGRETEGGDWEERVAGVCLKEAEKRKRVE